MTNWIIAIVIGWFLRGFTGGESDVQSRPNLLDSGTPPSPKVPSVEDALKQLDGIEERIRRDGIEMPRSGLASVRAALTENQGGPKRE